ncbi:hypothetical protein MXE01_15670, partial [Legionella pneumophila]|nr:hypothetical protein [Legionella pneumophila]
AVPNLNSPEIIHALADFINNRNGHVYLLMGKGFNDFRERFYGGTNQSANFGNVFSNTPNYGADGAGSTVMSYSLGLIAASGADSGL